MKTILTTFCAISVFFGLFSFLYAQQKPSYPRLDHGYGVTAPGASEESSRQDRERRKHENFLAEADYNRRFSHWHDIVMAVSAVYFLGAIAVILLHLRLVPTSTGWRKLLIAAASVAVLMLIWTSILSGSISFNEVYPAWIVVSAFYAAGAFVLLRGSPGNKEAPQNLCV